MKKIVYIYYFDFCNYTISAQSCNATMASLDSFVVAAAAASGALPFGEAAGAVGGKSIDDAADASSNVAMAPTAVGGGAGALNVAAALIAVGGGCGHDDGVSLGGGAAAPRVPGAIPASQRAATAEVQKKVDKRLAAEAAARKPIDDANELHRTLAGFENKITQGKNLTFCEVLTFYTNQAAFWSNHATADILHARGAWREYSEAVRGDDKRDKDRDAYGKTLRTPQEIVVRVPSYMMRNLTSLGDVWLDVQSCLPPGAPPYKVPMPYWTTPTNEVMTVKMDDLHRVVNQTDFFPDSADYAKDLLGRLVSLSDLDAYPSKKWKQKERLPIDWPCAVCPCGNRCPRYRPFKAGKRGRPDDRGCDGPIPLPLSAFPRLVERYTMQLRGFGSVVSLLHIFDDIQGNRSWTYKSSHSDKPFSIYKWANLIPDDMRALFVPADGLEIRFYHPNLAVGAADWRHGGGSAAADVSAADYEERVKRMRRAEEEGVEHRARMEREARAMLADSDLVLSAEPLPTITRTMTAAELKYAEEQNAEVQADWERSARAYPWKYGTVKTLDGSNTHGCNRCAWGSPECFCFDLMEQVILNRSSGNWDVRQVVPPGPTTKYSTWAVIVADHCYDEGGPTTEQENVQEAAEDYLLTHGFEVLPWCDWGEKECIRFRMRDDLPRGPLDDLYLSPELVERAVTATALLLPETIERSVTCVELWSARIARVALIDAPGAPDEPSAVAPTADYLTIDELRQLSPLVSRAMCKFGTTCHGDCHHLHKEHLQHFVFRVNPSAHPTPRAVRESGGLDWEYVTIDRSSLGKVPRRRE